MIHILYYGGTFGTTIEYCLKRFSSEFCINDLPIWNNGSMHAYTKEYHPKTLKEIKEIPLSDARITSPLYPNDELNSESVINEFKQVIAPDDKVIFIILKNTTDYLNAMLLLSNKLDYRKIVGADGNSNHKKWNKTYNSIDDLRPWELREYYSLIHKVLCPEVIAAGNMFSDNWLVINFNDLIFNFVPTIKQMIAFSKLTLIEEDKLVEYHLTWVKHQLNIINEQTIINNIISKILNKEFYSWNKLSLMAESLLQYELSNLGIELKVFNVDELPTNTTDILSLVA